MTASPRRATGAARLRHQRLRNSFDTDPRKEYHRYAGEARRRFLQRELRERFLQRHLPRGDGPILELGPGPGRFTPLLLRTSSARVILADLSRPVLLSNRRRTRRPADRRRTSWVRAAGEHLPLRDRSVDTVVLLGNIVSMAADDGPQLLAELRRVCRPGALLLADFASPAAATQEFFYVAARRRLLPRILRDPSRYFLDRVLATGRQPYAPHRLARWEFQFYTVDSATAALRTAGFRVVDRMSVAPITSFQESVARIARRERATWETLLRIEEQVGRRTGALEIGHGFLVAARFP